ncbi:MAG: hypothetical protein K2P81_10790 [Bacteriovoracaceae bacterium]|nr:hypothetical protein [Bacteriovoracaceae bacterium]
MRLIALILMIWPTLLWASWKVGDVVLQPLRCYLCSMIETHERSIYSHMALVVQTEPEVLVTESWGKVRVTSLSTFINKGDLTRPHLAIRLNEEPPKDLMEAILPLIGSDYDHDFRWDNLGSDGREALYCSELITKVLNPYLQNQIPTKIMDYTENHEAWSRYFQGHIPQGLPGNSPADFERSPLFRPVATLKEGLWIWN